MKWQFVSIVTMTGFLTAAIAYRIGAGISCQDTPCSQAQYIAAGTSFATIDLIAYWLVVLIVLLSVRAWQRRQAKKGDQHKDPPAP